MAKSEEQQAINKAWHLLNAFNYEWVKKKNLVLLEYGTSITGNIDYILVCNKITEQINYRFDYDPFKGWSFRSFLVKKEEI